MLISSRNIEEISEILRHLNARAEKPNVRCQGTPWHGGIDLEGGMGMCGPGDPLFTHLLPFARVPFQAKESVHKTPFWENFEILACTASIFTQILAHVQPPKFGNFQLTSPQIWKFSAHKPPFQQAPYFGNPGRTPLPEKKLNAPREGTP